MERTIERHISSRKKSLLLDLDRTIFNTDAYNRAAHQAIAQICSVTAAQLHAEAPSYFVYPDRLQPTSYFYPLFSHLEQGHRIPPDQAQQVIRDHVASSSFIYDDVVPTLASLQSHPDLSIGILTYGDYASQTFKVNLYEAALGIYALACIQYPDKGGYIRATTDEQETVLIVDDKRIANLPSWCIGVEIDRTAQVPLIYNDYSYTINSLAVVPWLLDHVCDETDIIVT